MAMMYHQEPATVSQFEQLRCSACKIMVSPNEKMSHYRSDWHRYNVKRKCVGMAPLSKSLFESKLNAIIANGKQVNDSSHRKQKTANGQKAAENLDALTRSKQWKQDTSSLRDLLDSTQSLLVFKCTLCRKTFKSHQQCSSHLANKKHRYEFMKYHRELRAAQQMEIDVFKATNGDNPESEAASVPTQHALNALVPLDQLEVDLSIKGNPFVKIEPFQPRIPKDQRYIAAPNDEAPNDEAPHSDEVEEQTLPPAIDPTKQCLFCDKLDPESVNGIDDVMTHMEMEHGFFIPRPERLIALQPLLEVAGKIIGNYYQCCWCWRQFVSLEALQSHMRDMGHCKLMIDDDSNPFQDHFDWEKRIEIDWDNVSEDEDGEWKTNEDGMQVMVRSNRAHIEEINDDHELVRSDGTRIGHRQYAVAYKQRPERLRGNRETQTEEQIIAQINNPNKKLRMEMMLKKKAQEAIEAAGVKEQTKGANREAAKKMAFQEKAHVASLENWIALQKSRCLF